ncbi:MAG: hypothetical protein E3K37_06870 [Candidatus Kuenenia sp.]|nr:hypothetical protein [Candidatus Kuenenia hertensis]
MKIKYFAHSLKDKPIDEWHLLEDHLFEVAGLAKSFADEFWVGRIDLS